MFCWMFFTFVFFPPALSADRRAKLCNVIGNWQTENVDTRYQNLGALPKKNLEKRPKSGTILDNFRLLSRISSERIVRRNKFGEVLSTNKKLEIYSDPPKINFFGRTRTRYLIPPSKNWEGTNVQH